MEGITIKIILNDNGEINIGCSSIHPFEKFDPKFLNMALDGLKQLREKEIGKIDEKFYDEEYFEGKSKKSGLENYDNNTKSWTEEHAKERIERLINLCKGDKTWKILEIGCAFGHVVDYLRGLGYNAYGCDISEYAINKYPQKYKMKGNISFASSLYLEVDYDLIYGFNLMEHITELDLRQTLWNFSRWLRERKGLIFLTIDPIYGIDLSHQTIKPRDWWDSLFLESGFKIHEAGTEMFRKINGHVYQKL